jgi:cell division protease FtsH
MHVRSRLCLMANVAASLAAGQAAGLDMDRKWTFNLGYFIVAFALLLLFQAWLGSRDVAQLTYSQAVQDAKEGKIVNVTITETLIEGQFKSPINGRDCFVAQRVDPAAAEIFESLGVDVAGGSDSNWLPTLASWVAPTLIFFGIWLLISRSMAQAQGLGGLVNIGKSKAKSPVLSSWRMA